MTDPDRHAWVEPGAFPVAEGVYRIPLPLPTDGLRAVNVYAIAHDEGIVLIDAGWALEVSQQALVEALASIGYGLGDITRFCVTHAHRDHYTQANAVRRVMDSVDHASALVGMNAIRFARSPIVPRIPSRLVPTRRLPSCAVPGIRGPPTSWSRSFPKV